MTRMILKAGDTVLPAPVSISVNDEIVWTSDSGRSLSAYMMGDVVAEKKTVSVKWGIMTEEQVVLIKEKLLAGFFPFTFHDDGVDITIEAYRGTLSKKQIGYLGDGLFYYQEVAVDIVQR